MQRCTGRRHFAAVEAARGVFGQFHSRFLEQVTEEQQYRRPQRRVGEQLKETRRQLDLVESRRRLDQSRQTLGIAAAKFTENRIRLHPARSRRCGCDLVKLDAVRLSSAQDLYLSPPAHALDRIREQTRLHPQNRKRLVHHDSEAADLFVYLNTGRRYPPYDRLTRLSVD